MKDHAERLDSLAKRLRIQANDLKFDNFLSFIYTFEIVNKYLDTELRKFGLSWTPCARQMLTWMPSLPMLLPMPLSKNGLIRKPAGCVMAIILLCRFPHWSRPPLRRLRSHLKLQVTRTGKSGGRCSSMMLSNSYFGSGSSGIVSC